MHPKAIWQIQGRQYIYYFPYFSSMTRVKNGQWLIGYNGGEELVRLANTSLISFVGVNKDTGSLPLTFILEAGKQKTAIMVCNTHQRQPSLIMPQSMNRSEDVLTAQILHRENEKQAAYVSRILVGEMFKARGKIAEIPTVIETQLGGTRNRKEVMKIEALASRDYWTRFYNKVNEAGLSRREPHPINDALNALSRYQSGIILRWCLVHGLSPIHGYLHARSEYEGLVYDLMEPYRYLVEMAVYDTVKNNGACNSEKLIQLSTARYKALLNEEVYIEPTNQRVYRKAMLHGSVIALRHYLLKKMKRFLPPRETTNIQGRPFKCSYMVPGEIIRK